MKSNPIPTRFAPAESAYINRIAKMTGLSSSEIIRRSVRLMRRQVRRPVDCHILISLA